MAIATVSNSAEILQQLTCTLHGNRSIVAHLATEEHLIRQIKLNVQALLPVRFAVVKVEPALLAYVISK